MTMILVTGARGFVGRVLLAELARKGIAVRAVTRKTTRPADNGVEWITVNSTPEADWTKALRNVSCIVHLADGLRAFEKTNNATPVDGPRLIESTINLAKTAVAANVSRFIYVSSIKAAAGEISDRTLDETVEPAPATKYGYMKQKCEQALSQALSGTPLELTIIRNPIVYGPGATNNMARLLSWADTPVPLPFNALENRRSIISVNNLASALASVATHQGDGAGSFYVHDGDRLSTGEIVSIFRSNLGRPERFFTLPEAVWKFAAKLPIIGGTARRIAGTLLLNDMKLRQQFRWTPIETSEDALGKMVRAYRAKNKTAKSASRRSGKNIRTRKNKPLSKL